MCVLVYFVFVGVADDVGGPLVYLKRCPRWGSVNFWFVAHFFMIESSSAWPVPAAVSLGSLVYC